MNFFLIAFCVGIGALFLLMVLRIQTWKVKHLVIGLLCPVLVAIILYQAQPEKSLSTETFEVGTAEYAYFNKEKHQGTDVTYVDVLYADNFALVAVLSEKSGLQFHIVNFVDGEWVFHNTQMSMIMVETPEELFIKSSDNKNEMRVCLFSEFYMGSYTGINSNQFVHFVQVFPDTAVDCFDEYTRISTDEGIWFWAVIDSAEEAILRP